MATVNGMRKEPDYTAARRAMIRTQLQRRGITDRRVLQAMREVPRHAFVPPEWRHEAYSDRPLPIANDQTISQPYMVAIMTQSLVLQGHERVLEATHVYTIEYFPDLAERARAILRHLGYANVQVITSDGGLGLPAYAPYHGILVAAAAPHVPQPLLTQLAEGGRLVIPVGSVTSQELLIISRHGDEYAQERSVPCRFVPLLGQEGWADT
jgi:protein-L-isoaspartate(D-aspartate) O-methyltransferase